MPDNQKMMHILTSIIPLVSSASLILDYISNGVAIRDLLLIHGGLCAMCLMVAFYKDVAKNWFNVARMGVALVLSGFIMLPFMADVLLADMFTAVFYYGMIGVIGILLATALGVLTWMAYEVYEQNVWRAEEREEAAQSYYGR